MRSPTSSTSSTTRSSACPEAGCEFTIGDVSDILGVHFPDDEWDTVGGLVYNLLGRVPEGGETITSEGYDFTVERMEGQRIMSVLVSPTPERREAPAALTDATP